MTEKTVFLASFQLGYKGAASLLLRWVPARFCLGCPDARQGGNIVLLVFQAESTVARPVKHLFVSVCCLSLFSLFIMVLLPLAFIFSYKKKKKPNYPPFLSMNQSFGYPTRFPKPSKQLWLWCWPRFIVSLEQYVALCLGFSALVYEYARSSVIVYSPKSACQFVINVIWQPRWVY